MEKLFKAEKIKVFAGSSNLPLARRIADAMGFELSDMQTGQFSDGESYVKVNEIVRGYDIYIIQSISEPVNDNLMELLIVVDAMRRASAGRITVVIPYLAYARQDVKYSAREPITVKLVANLLEASGIDNVITMDLHSTQIQGFFKKPLINLKGIPLFVDYYRRKIKDEGGDFVVVAPGTGSMKRNRQIAEQLDVPLAIVDGMAGDIGDSIEDKVIGNITGKNIIMIDDIIDTGNTIINAMNIFKACDVKKVFVAGIHPILAGQATKMLNATDIDELVILDTINHESDGKKDGFVVLSVCDIFANAIISIHKDRSVSRLYDVLLEVDKE